MALTLAQYKAYTTNAKSSFVIDDLQKESLLLQLLPFTDNGAGINGKWIYQYDRDEAQATADTRLVNEEYTPAEVVAPVAYTTELSILGGSYTLDRVMRDMGGVNALVDRQEAKLIQATTKKFNDLVINGDNTNPGEFDGLDVALSGTTTEYNAAATINLSDMTNITNNWMAFRFALNKFLALLGRRPDAFLVTDDFAAIFNEVAQRAGVYAQTTDNFGQMVSNYNGIPFIPMGTKSGSSTQVIPVETRNVGGSVTNLTDIYAVSFGPQEFHGVSPNDKSKLLTAYEPDFDRPGAVHLGEVEMVATIALESTKAAGVLRNIKIA